MKEIDLRKATRKTWHVDRESEDDYIGHDNMNLGCLMRIADATEVMAKNYNDLIAERDKIKRWYNGAFETAKSLRRRISALRGVITKLRKQLDTRKQSQIGYNVLKGKMEAAVIVARDFSQRHEAEYKKNAKAKELMELLEWAKNTGCVDMEIYKGGRVRIYSFGNLVGSGLSLLLALRKAKEIIERNSK
jgi:hypothetical protein